MSGAQSSASGWGGLPRWLSGRKQVRCLPAPHGGKGTPSKARDPRNNAYFTTLALSFQVCDPFTLPVLGYIQASGLLLGTISTSV